MSILRRCDDLGVESSPVMMKICLRERGFFYYFLRFYSTPGSSKRHVLVHDRFFFLSP